MFSKVEHEKSFIINPDASQVLTEDIHVHVYY